MTHQSSPAVEFSGAADAAEQAQLIADPAGVPGDGAVAVEGMRPETTLTEKIDRQLMPVASAPPTIGPKLARWHRPPRHGEP